MSKKQNKPLQQPASETNADEPIVDQGLEEVSKVKKREVDFTKAFAYSPNNGINIERYSVGVHQVSPECADIAQKGGFLKK